MGSIPIIIPILRELGPRSNKDVPASPCGRAKNLTSECQNVKILEKFARCAPQKVKPHGKCRDSAAENAKSKDPTKMTHSIPDFTSCNAKY